MKRVDVPVKMFRWAMERADMSEAHLRRRFAKLESWLAGTEKPTLKQLEAFALATHAPVGYFFLRVPPEEPIPIPDYRTFSGKPLPKPSANLLDTIYLCQQRQEWYREYAKAGRNGALRFIGSATTEDDTVKIAGQIREALGFDLKQRRNCRTWADALRQFIEQTEELGVLVMVSGVVGSNNTRKLNVEEFRGFALSDSLAPLIFINGADSKSAQMFTLAHELAHLWLGQSALSDATVRDRANGNVERWCDQVAAELLVPLEAIRDVGIPNGPLRGTLESLAREFKVSTLVVLRRLHDARHLSQEEFWTAYDEELKHLRQIASTKGGGGGDYYLTTAARVGRRFARAVITATWEGRSSFTEAFRLIGCRKTQTLLELGKSLGVSD